MRLGLLALVLLVVQGCVSHSLLLGAADDQTSDILQLADPGQYVYLIYNHGSLPEDQRDLCNPKSRWLPGRVPPVVALMDGLEIDTRSVVVYALCSIVPARFDNNDPSQIKVRLRVGELSGLVDGLHRRGVPSRQIFLVGHSAGAWAALLFQRQKPEAINAVVGFAPAFAGVKDLRNEHWTAIRQRHQNWLADATSSPALLYGFNGDPYYSLEDLAFFRDIPGVVFHWVEGPRCMLGHRAVFGDCFRQHGHEEILQFLRDRLAH